MTIYLLCDIELLLKHNITLENYLKKTEDINPIYIQYRDKINNQEMMIKNLKLIVDYFKHKDTKIIINDHIKLINYCHGVHIGQEDLKQYAKNSGIDIQTFIKKLKIKYPNKTIGLSTHNKNEIIQANDFDLDYIGLGAYRATSTKKDINIIGKKAEQLAILSKHKVAI
ncbi:MAG: hypothetical protein B1H07_01875 [Campylobacteraceae bacterium 4484_166]|nr:MAG: hypothetical protein B1H07_01875 [Campylobacteraceae bacterium 4484_166]